MATKNTTEIEVVKVDQSFELKDNIIEFYASLDEFIVIGPKEVKGIRTGIKLKVPEGYYVLVAIDYELMKETMLTFASGCVMIEAGEHDEIELDFVNLTRKSVTINHGDVIANGVLCKINEFNIKEVDSFNLRGDNDK